MKSIMNGTKLFSLTFGSLFCFGFTVLFLSGCATTSVMRANYSNISRIKAGETTEAELIQMFGQPMQRGIDSDGMPILRWMYVESSVKGEAFIPYAGAFMGGSRSNYEILNVRLTNGKVTKFDFSRGADSVNQHSLVLKSPQIRPMGGVKVEFPSGVYSPHLLMNHGVYYRAPGELVQPGLGVAANKKGGVYVPATDGSDQRQGVWLEKSDPPGQPSRDWPYTVYRFSDPIAFEKQPARDP